MFKGKVMIEKLPCKGSCEANLDFDFSIVESCDKLLDCLSPLCLQVHSIHIEVNEKLHDKLCHI
jgi:hypothetical protein